MRLLDQSTIVYVTHPLVPLSHRSYIINAYGFVKTISYRIRTPLSSSPPGDTLIDKRLFWEYIPNL